MLDEVAAATPTTCAWSSASTRCRCTPTPSSARARPSPPRRRALLGHARSAVRQPLGDGPRRGRRARTLGLDVAAFEAALDDPATAAKVQADKRAGAELGIRGTPSGFVNGIAFSGAPKPEALTEMIERERALGRRLIEAGSTRAQVYARIVKAAGGRKPAARAGCARPHRQTAGR
ncbi:MAG: DsbA family protein [Nannocystaceae bacterium]